MRLSITVSVTLLAIFFLGLSSIPDSVGPPQSSTAVSTPDPPGEPAVEAAPSSRPLIINEILFAPADTDAEFIEILNGSDAPVSLHDVFYADGNEDFDPVLPASMPDPLAQAATLPPGGYLVLVRDSAAFAEAFPAAPPASTGAPIAPTAETSPALVIAPDGWEGLNNGGDTVFLRTGDVITNRVTYESDWAGDDASTERIDPNGPAEAFNFESATHGENSESGRANTATPGMRNSVYEVDQTPPKLLSAEERPPSAHDGTVIRLVFSEGLDASTVTSSAFRLGTAASSVVSSVELHDNLRVIDLSLSRDHPPLEQLAPGTDGDADGPAYGTAPLIRVRGLEDRLGNLLVSAEHPVALQPPAASLRITEIMFDPRSDAHDGWPDQTEYVEIENVAEKRVTIRGTQLVGTRDEHGDRDLLAGVETGDALDPGERAVLFADRGLPATELTPLAALHQAFPDIDTTSGSWIPVPSSSLRLTNSGRSLLLMAPDSTRLDSLDYDPDWHATDLLSTDGVALERISTGAASDDAANWTSTAHPDGGTPGAVNSVHLASEPVLSREPSRANVQVSPSPFSIERDAATRIRYSLNGPRSLRVEIYDAHGRPIRTLATAQRSAAQGELLWDGRDDAGQRVPVGIYVVWFEAVDADGGQVETAKKTVVLARPL